MFMTSLWATAIRKVTILMFLCFLEAGDQLSLLFLHGLTTEHIRVMGRRGVTLAQDPMSSNCNIVY